MFEGAAGDGSGLITQAMSTPRAGYERIAVFVNLWQARLVMDATGVGDPVFDDLRRVLPHVEGFKITAQTKRELVQGLMVAVEQRRVLWPMGKRMKDEG